MKNVKKQPEVDKKVDELKKKLQGLREEYEETVGKNINNHEPDREMELAEMHAALHELQKVNERHLASLNTSEQHGRQLKRVIQHLRERGEESQLEARHLRAELQQAQEKISLLLKELQASGNFSILPDHPSFQAVQEP